MEQLLTPSIVVPSLLAAIAFVVWLVRLEGRINSSDKDVAKFKEDTVAWIKEVEADLKDTRTRYFEHAANAAVHHNAEAYGEFKVALERRMLGMEGSLKEIGLKLDQIRQHQ
jgi:hypothetical protein